MTFPRLDLEPGTPYGVDDGSALADLSMAMISISCPGLSIDSSVNASYIHFVLRSAIFEMFHSGKPNALRIYDRSICFLSQSWKSVSIYV